MINRPTSIFECWRRVQGNVAVFGCVIVLSFDTMLKIEEGSKRNLLCGTN